MSVLSLSEDELLATNLFAYCANNPVNNSDPSGYWKVPKWNSKFVIAGIINLAIMLIVGSSIYAFKKTISKKIKSVGYSTTKRWLKYRIKVIVKRKAVKYTVLNRILTGVDIAFNVLTCFLDPGGYIFDVIDARDKKPHNGYWEL